MAGAYSADLRERVVEAINQGTARRAAGRIFKVSASTAVRWAQRFRDTGTSAAKRSAGGIFVRAALKRTRTGCWRWWPRSQT